MDPPPNAGVRKNSRSRSSSKGDNLSSLAKRVAAKLEDGDFRGAVRLACSDDRLAPYNSATLSALRDKHPSPPSDSAIPPTLTHLLLLVLLDRSLVALLVVLTVYGPNTSRTSCSQREMTIRRSCRRWPLSVR